MPSVRIRPICKFPGCGKPTNSAVKIGYCNGHYLQFTSGRSLKPLQRQVTSASPCSFPGCDRKVKYWGLCDTHCAQKRNGTPLFPIGSHRRVAKKYFCKCGKQISRRASKCAECYNPKLSCSLCGRPVKAYGMCAMHWTRFKKHGDPQVIGYCKSQEGTVSTRGGVKYIKATGHAIADPHGFVPLHRFLAYALQPFERNVKVSIKTGMPIGRKYRIRACKTCGSPVVRYLGNIGKNQFCADCSYAKGEFNGRCKLTEMTVLELRIVIAAGMVSAESARRLGVTNTTCRNIATGKLWSHIPFQKKGQSFHDYLLEAITYRSRILNKGQRQSGVADSPDSPRPVQKRRLSDRSLPRKSGRQGQQTIQVQRPVRARVERHDSDDRAFSKRKGLGKRTTRHSEGQDLRTTIKTNRQASGERHPAYRHASRTRRAEA